MTEELSKDFKNTFSYFLNKKVACDEK